MAMAIETDVLQTFCDIKYGAAFAERRRSLDQEIKLSDETAREQTGQEGASDQKTVSGVELSARTGQQSETDRAASPQIKLEVKEEVQEDKSVRSGVAEVKK